MDVEPILELAERGTTLEPVELMAVSDALSALGDLKAYFADDESPDFLYKPATPRLRLLADAIELDPALVALLADAFDAEGELCGRKFPEIGRLRRHVKSLTDAIRAAMARILASREFAGMLAEEGRGAYVSEVNGRFCLPVKPTYKRGVGIVHDSSRTGKTLFVEPSSVVEPTNELTEAKLELRAETRRVLARMTVLVATNRAPLTASLEAAAALDLAAARARLGRRLRGVIPEVQDGGCVALTGARHPVLCLRGKDPVGNDLRVDGERQALVLTGPNAGGKTIVLKTLGLVALMVRTGIPIPAQAGARVDLFEPVLADIGDLQSVTGDLSTFSGHLMVCNAVLAGARAGALVLMDEMGSGTDPAQGAALAQALLEALLEAGARVALTTHFLQLKELAARDKRFAVAAMEFVDGRPTYRMRQGAVGESFALAVAERLRLPAPVLERARNLLNEDVRRVSDLVLELEQQRGELEATAAALEAAWAAVAGREAAAAAALREAAELKRVARREAAAEYAAEIAAREARLKEVLDAVRADPSVAVVGSGIGELRAVRRAAEEQAEDDGGAADESAGLRPLDDGHPLSVGDRVVVLARGVVQGREGTVRRLRRGGEVEVDVGGFATMRLRLQDLSLPPTNASGKKAVGNRSAASGRQQQAGRRIGGGSVGGDGGRLSKRVAQYLEKEASTGPRREIGNSHREARGGGAAAAWPAAGGDSGGGNNGRERTSVRLPGNTLDLRGKTLEEARDACDRYFNTAVMAGKPVVFVLHGHGTGVLKKGLREWLPRAGLVKRARPADYEDGGDAFTVVEFR
ncbi:unnamed protein product [Phaeothamnion confervicola]